MWHWMDVAECRRTGAPKYYRPKKEKEWRQTQPYGIDYKEDSSKPKTHDMRVRLDGRTHDMIKSQGDWNEDCVGIGDGGSDPLVLRRLGGRLWNHRVRCLAC